MIKIWWIWFYHEKHERKRLNSWKCNWFDDHHQKCWKLIMSICFFQFVNCFHSLIVIVTSNCKIDEYFQSFFKMQFFSCFQRKKFYIRWLWMIFRCSLSRKNFWCYENFRNFCRNFDYDFSLILRIVLMICCVIFCCVICFIVETFFFVFFFWVDVIFIEIYIFDKFQDFKFEICDKKYRVKKTKLNVFQCKFLVFAISTILNFQIHVNVKKKIIVFNSINWK